MTDAEQSELSSYLRIYAAEMQVQHGEAVAQELITGMLTGQSYLKSAPKTEAQKSAVSEGALIIRDQDNQQQDLANLSRDINLQYPANPLVE